MTRNKSVEYNNAIVVRFLYTSHESRVQVCGVIRIAIAVGIDARVNSSGIAAPDLKICLRNWLACIDINDLNVKSQRHACLTFGDVLSDKLSRDPVRPLGSLWCQNAGVVAGE